jgi:hypothetical protein
MTKTFAVLAAAALLVACGEDEIDPQAVRNAMPAAETIQIGVPEAPASASAGTRRAALGEEPAYGSGLAHVSYWTAVSVNGGVWWALTLVRLVTLFPPTACDASTCTWGPWVDDDGLNRWQLVVTRDGDAYEWVFSAQPGSQPAAPFSPIMLGVAHPGVDRHRGHGSFTVDFEAAADLDHGVLWQQTDFGTLTVVYDNRTSLSIDATALGTRTEEPGVFMNAVYAFDATGTGGELQLAFETIEDVPANLSLRTRWDDAGAGRGDAQYVEGGLTYRESECWAGASASFALVYDTNPVRGAESACAFAPAAYADVIVP